MIKKFEYSIETLEIELNRIKGLIRSIKIMQDEMYQKHPGLELYEQIKSELEESIKIIKNQ